MPVGMPDVGVVGGNPGVGANIASNPPGIGGGVCAELNGNNSNYNLGDVAELNEVSAFTIAFWMKQDVIDIGDWMFRKTGAGGNHVGISTSGDGFMYIEPTTSGTNEGRFNYSTAINAGQWHHLSIVFNGVGIGNAGRLQVYVDAVPIALGFIGTIQAATGDMSGFNTYIGYTSAALDGELDEFMIFTDPLTNLNISDLMLRTRRGLLKP